MIWSLSRYVLIAALRDKVFISFLILVALGISLSFFMGSAALIERQQFAIVFAAGGLRIAGMAGLVLFAVFYMRRAFDDHEVEYLLSRPVTRIGFIGAHSLSFSILALFMGLLIFAGIYLMVPQDFSYGHALWGYSVIIELIIMVNAALFFSMVLPSATVGVLVVFGLYVLSRMMGQILGILQDPHSGTPMLLENIMNVISVFIPRLDLMGQTSWLIYVPMDNIDYGFITIQGLVFTALMIAASMIDLVRKQF